jgi:hypothetical protein
LALPEKFRSNGYRVSSRMLRSKLLGDGVVVSKPCVTTVFPPLSTGPMASPASWA